MSLCDNEYPSNPSAEVPVLPGPILRLPPEILNHIVKYLRPNGILSFRQTCRHLYHNACSRITLKNALSDRVLPRESLALACMMERDGRLRKNRLVCAACPHYHSSTSFDSMEKLLPPKIRLCEVEKFERKTGYASALGIERCFADHLPPISLMCSACKGSHRFDMFDVGERLKPSADRICTVFANIFEDRDFIPTLKTCRWGGGLDPFLWEGGDRDLSTHPAILKQLALSQARCRQLSGRPDQYRRSTTGGQSCED